MKFKTLTFLILCMFAPLAAMEAKNHHPMETRSKKRKRSEHENIQNAIQQTYEKRQRGKLLLDCARLGQIETALQQIKRCAELDMEDTEQWTPLHWAVKHGDFEIAEALVAAGANVNSQTIAGVTPLHFAAQNGHIAMIKLLLNAGALAEAEDLYGDIPLDFVPGWMSNNIQILKLLSCQTGHMPF